MLRFLIRLLVSIGVIFYIVYFFLSFYTTVAVNNDKPIAEEELAGTIIVLLLLMLLIVIITLAITEFNNTRFLKKECHYLAYVVCTKKYPDVLIKLHITHLSVMQNNQEKLAGIAKIIAPSSFIIFLLQTDNLKEYTLFQLFLLFSCITISSLFLYTVFQRQVTLNASESIFSEQLFLLAIPNYDKDYEGNDPHLATRINKRKLPKDFYDSIGFSNSILPLHKRSLLKQRKK
ncbi:hypothetical protein HCA55_12330 [Listeria booriae]|uniref:Uncharacterized protein n=1 Tax=Listeria booriae TaxID=1552123 RepID=A0A842B4G6_9LIST|nr:hypothetical protein [Listeria booriae]MBC1317745.1 hypothetical protein [Listeria booriae]MBC1797517.1 hypothetical protein [Listeria booriae]MBC2328019.1 hypothetical protein [Listeria booriae]